MVGGELRRAGVRCVMAGLVSPLNARPGGVGRRGSCGSIPRWTPRERHGSRFGRQVRLDLPENQDITLQIDAVRIAEDGTIDVLGRSPENPGSHIHLSLERSCPRPFPTDPSPPWKPFPTGGVLAAGTFTTADGIRRTGVVRLKAYGSVDPRFNPPERLTSTVQNHTVPPVEINCLLPHSSGRMLLGGFIALADGRRADNLVRMEADGRLDTSFQPPTLNGVVWSLAEQLDGKILVAGHLEQFNGKAVHNLVRWNADGSLDTRFPLLETGNSALVESIAMLLPLFLDSKFKSNPGLQPVSARLAQGLPLSACCHGGAAGTGDGVGHIAGVCGGARPASHRRARAAAPDPRSRDVSSGLRLWWTRPNSGRAPWIVPCAGRSGWGPSWRMTLAQWH